MIRLLIAFSLLATPALAVEIPDKPLNIVPESVRGDRTVPVRQCAPCLRSAAAPLTFHHRFGYWAGLAHALCRGPGNCR